MNNEFINTFILAASFLMLFGIAEVLYHKFKVQVDFTRKIVHLGTGLLTLLFPIMLGNHWLVLLLCASFAIILLTSLKFDFLKSINAIDRVSYGSISYPIAVYGCYLVFDYFSREASLKSDMYIYFYLPILTLAICDPASALAGKKYPKGVYKIGKGSKTMVGVLAFFLTSLGLNLLMFGYLKPPLFNLESMLISSVVLAVCGAAAEALTGKGLDNITIPAIVALILIYLS